MVHDGAECRPADRLGLRLRKAVRIEVAGRTRRGQEEVVWTPLKGYRMVFLVL